jgi:hypothetical protein
MLSQEQRTADTAMHLFSTAQATGMQLKKPEGSSPDVLLHLMEEFKDRVIKTGYRVHLSDHRINLQGEDRERYYLKPSMSGEGLKPPLPQRFGNVLIEIWGSGSGKAEHLKVLITVYSDRLYTPAGSGMVLISSLLE